MSDQRITNLSYLEQLDTGDDEIIVEMVEMFLENTPESIELLEKHVKAGNWKKLGAEAHKLKPNLSYVGLDQARDIILEIENLAKNDPDAGQLKAKIEQLNGICKQAYRELEEQLQELKK